MMINIILLFSRPARYIDPVTCVPYHNSSCLKIIRSAYAQQLEVHGDRSNPVVSEWLNWYSKNKDRLHKEMLLKIKAQMSKR